MKSKDETFPRNIFVDLDTYNFTDTQRDGHKKDACINVIINNEHDEFYSEKTPTNRFTTTDWPRWSYIRRQKKSSL